MKTFLLVTHCLLLALSVQAYLPGFAPNNFCPEETATATCKKDVRILANVVTSTKNMVTYSYDQIGFCYETNYQLPGLNLGQILSGERLVATKISASFLKDNICQVSCKKVYNPGEEWYAKLFLAIQYDYQYQWRLDGMPVVVGQNNEVFRNRIPMGCLITDNFNYCSSFVPSSQPGKVYLFNHVDITVEYHNLTVNSLFGRGAPEHAARIVGVKAYPSSKNHQNKNSLDCSRETPIILEKDLKQPLTVLYTYSITFVENTKIEWSSRWDYLLQAHPHSRIQWISIANSLVILVFLTGLVAFILIRTLRRDINRYNELDNAMESPQEDFGWKLVHADVFRAPYNPMLLSVFAGFGMQIFCMTLFTLFFGYVAFSSPAYRGYILTSGLVSFVLFGVVAGYTSSRLYKLMGGVRWKANVLMTALFCPGICFIIYLLINIVLAAVGSSEAIPFGTLVGVLALWLCISIPLCLIGSMLGFKRPPIPVPVRTNPIPRQIPKQSFNSRLCLSSLLSGSLPFGCVFVQLYMMYSSLWGTQVYYMFGFMFLVFVMFVISTCETAILMCYFQLCAEDYHWWWKAFISVGSSALYVFCYSLHYYLTNIETTDSTSRFLYFGYVSMITWLFFLMSGTIGLLACLWFVRKIYSVVKVD